MLQKLVDFDQLAEFLENKEEIPFADIGNDLELSREQVRNKFVCFCRELGLEKVSKAKEDLNVVNKLLACGFRSFEEVDWLKTKSKKSARNFKANKEVISRYLRLVDPHKVKSFREDLEKIKKLLSNAQVSPPTEEKETKKEFDLAEEYKKWIN